MWRGEVWWAELPESVASEPGLRPVLIVQSDDFNRSRIRTVVAVVLTTKLRKGIREHRDGSGHALCWHHPSLWGLLPETTDPLPVVPEWPEFIRGCLKYRQSLDEQAPKAPRTNEPYEE